MQVYFVGSEAKIDMRPSSVWLREKTAKWPWKTHLRVGAKRDEALEILSSEGTLLVLCSLVDNMPYVVAEAAVRSPACVFNPRPCTAKKYLAWQAALLVPP